MSTRNKKGSRKHPANLTKVESRTGSGRDRSLESNRTAQSAVNAAAEMPCVLTRSAAWVALALITLNMVVFAAVGHHDFVSFDDPEYITDNSTVSAGLTWQGVQWAFTTGRASNWHPLTWLSHMLDVQLYGLNPGGHHLTNLLFHIANTVLLFGLLLWMTGALGRSAFVAGMFAVHPLHVESVAWVSERKDVLSTLFWMLTVWAYVAYTRQPRLTRYVMVLLLFGLGLMAKPMLVTLPFVLLLLDYWPLKRVTLGAWTAWRSLVLEKLPLLVVAAASSIVTFLVQRRGGAVSGLDALPLNLRFANAAVSYVAYITKMLWPARLAAFYPFDRLLPGWWAAGSILVLAAVSVAAMRVARSHPYAAVGWLWYLGTLVPVIGLVQVGGQSMADRYTYVSLIGLFIIVAWGLPDLLTSWRYPRIALPAAAGLAVVACAITARAQVRHWNDSVALWSHAIEVTTDNDRAHTALGSLLVERGAANAAIAHFSEALRINPDFAEAHNKLGAALADQGKISEAVQQYSEALRIKPTFLEAHNNLANALAGQGKVNEAIAHYSEALRIRPNYADAHNGLGAVLADQGRVEEAMAHYREALRADPAYANAHNNLGVALAGAGRVDEAIQEFSDAVRIRPDAADFNYNLGMMLLKKGNTAEARRHLDAASKLNPAYHAGR